MKDKKEISRRKFLKIAGGIMGGGVLLCGGGTYFGLQTPGSVVFPESSCGEGENRVLVAYASKCGSTGEIAQFIAHSLCDRGFSVDLARARDVRSVAEYSTIVLGTAVYMANPLRESVDFAKNRLAGQSGKKVALFDVCLSMKENTEEDVQIAQGYLNVFQKYFTPALTGTFAGRIEYDTLPFIYRQFAQADKSDVLIEGDYRDWNQIDAWTDEIALL